MDQSDWDEHAERLMFALNTSFNATRLDSSFYLVHGWDAQGAIFAMLGSKPSTVEERTAMEWRRKMQWDYRYALACAEDLQKNAKRPRSAAQTRKWKELSDRVKAGFEAGDSVWLYIPKVRTGLSRKLVHIWHGPFRIDEIHDDFRVKRDSWEPDPAKDEYEVEAILDLRWIKRTRTSKRSREYLMKRKGYTDPEWIPLAQLNCGALLYEFNQGAKASARFQAMQAGDDHHGN
ncbi:reverse transcriptase [Phytophthora megakarya]|uniref:Reverse transcriptase n=1 Tax=Phytophthora megakarya TaxID=4795 RepID=A0A225W373_9STRA|nr:reverse transcriptase [Phytophthora megakarya]